MADTTYRNLNPKYDDTRYKVNNALLRMMNTNPALGIGYLIGNALGENYWGKKRAKTEQDADKKFWDDYMAKHGIGANENGVYGVNNNGAVNDLGRSVGSMSPMERRAQIITDMRDYLQSQGKTSGMVRPSEAAEWKARNDVLNSMGGSNGRVLFEGRSNPNAGVVVDTARGIYPRTPQQNNTSGVTVGNVDNGGGVSSVADGWNRMANGSGYNAGNTTMFTNGTRDLGNVIGADANGVYGVPGANPGVIVDTARGIYTGAAQQPENPGVYIDTARGIYPSAPQDTRPAAPTPYTDDQLRQIQGQNFTAEELAKMASPDELARMVVMMRGGAPAAQAPAQGGGILTSAAEKYAPATPAAPQQPANIDKIIAGDDEIYERGNPFAGQSTPLPVSHRGTRAMAADYNGRFITPGHDDSLTLGAIFGGGNQVDPKYAEMAAEWLKDWKDNG